MNHIMKSRRTRAYRSSLRQEQSEQTRRSILDALVRTMASGLSEVSIPAIAKEAGVSVPTVYRHFRTKRDLFDALFPYTIEKTGLGFDVIPQGLEDVDRAAREAFRRHAAVEPTIRAALASQVGREFRRTSMMPSRLEAMERGLARDLAGLPAEDRARVTKLATLLLSSSASRVYEEYFDFSPDEAAEYSAWAIRTLVRGVRARGRKRGKE